MAWEWIKLKAENVKEIEELKRWTSIGGFNEDLSTAMAVGGFGNELCVFCCRASWTCLDDLKHLRRLLISSKFNGTSSLRAWKSFRKQFRRCSQPGDWIISQTRLIANQNFIQPSSNEFLIPNDLGPACCKVLWNRHETKWLWNSFSVSRSNLLFRGLLFVLFLKVLGESICRRNKFSPLSLLVSIKYLLEPENLLQCNYSRNTSIVGLGSAGFAFIFRECLAVESVIVDFAKIYVHLLCFSFLLPHRQGCPRLICMRCLTLRAKFKFARNCIDFPFGNLFTWTRLLALCVQLTWKLKKLLGCFGSGKSQKYLHTMHKVHFCLTIRGREMREALSESCLSAARPINFYYCKHSSLRLISSHLIARVPKTRKHLMDTFFPCIARLLADSDAHRRRLSYKHRIARWLFRRAQGIFCFKWKMQICVRQQSWKAAKS